MSQVARYVRMRAHPGRGDELAALMVAVAEGLADQPGCRQYLINRDTSAPDDIWVTELWSDQAAVDAALQALQTGAGRARLDEVMALLSEPPRRTDLQPLGGIGFADAPPGR